MRYGMIFFAVLAGLLLFGWIYDWSDKTADKTLDKSIIVSLNGMEIKAELADTEEKRIKGLSGRESLKENRGMLFVYPESGLHGIWMKEMKFPIDIIWLGEDKKIVSMVENASPESYPEVFKPDQPARYVLEVNAGFAKSQSLKVGNAFCCFLLKYE